MTDTAAESSESSSSSSVHRFLISRHAKFFNRLLFEEIPAAFEHLDANRMTIMFFTLSGLNIIGQNELFEADDRRSSLIDWIYAQLLVDPSSTEKLDNRSGFRPGPFMTVPNADSDSKQPTHSLDVGHVTMTYTAIACLRILGDPMDRIPRDSILAGLRSLFTSTGRTSSFVGSSERDLRFTYSACATAALLKGVDTLPVAQIRSYILSCKNYDGGFGQCPGLESHGGSTYCAIASLACIGQLDPTEMRDTIRWLMFRQTGGFEGRPNKPADSCYTFWIGAALTLLCDGNPPCDRQKLLAFVAECESPFGGISKLPHYPPDPLHSYLGLAGIGLFGADGIARVDPALNIVVAERAT